MNDDEFDDLLKHFPDEEEGNDNEKKIPDADTMIYGFVAALQGVTKIISEHADIPEVALTDDDVQTLSQALKPLASWIMSVVQYMIYLPLIVFSVGYTLRVIQGLKHRKERKKKEIDIPKTEGNPNAVP